MLASPVVAALCCAGNGILVLLLQYYIVTSVSCVPGILSAFVRGQSFFPTKQQTYTLDYT
jgi:hypothetical protein